MSKFFPLKETTITVDGMQVKVRQLTQSERTQVVKATNEDRLSGPAVMASLATLEPKMTLEEALEEPASAIEAIVDAIMKLSGMGKKDLPEKEPDARRALQLPSGASDGSQPVTGDGPPVH